MTCRQINNCIIIFGLLGKITCRFRINSYILDDSIFRALDKKHKVELIKWFF